jgi:hypothetical protein
LCAGRSGRRRISQQAEVAMHGDRI